MDLSNSSCACNSLQSIPAFHLSKTYLDHLQYHYRLGVINVRGSARTRTTGALFQDNYRQCLSRSIQCYLGNRAHAAWRVVNLYGDGRPATPMVVHKVELVETEHSAGYRHFYELEYVFTVDNQRYSGTASLSDNPIQEEVEEDDAVPPANPTYLDVEYQSTSPQNSRAIGEGNLIGDIFPGLFMLGIGLWPTVAGVNFFEKGI